MASRTKRFLSPAIPLIVVCLAVGTTGCPKAEVAAGHEVPVLLTVDSVTNKVSANPPLAHLHYNNHDLALWKIDPASSAFDYDIEFKPPSNIPKPACSGTGMGRNCRSIVVTEQNAGTHQYKIVVHTSGGDVITDPEVTVDP